MNRTLIDVHVLQTVPPSNLNRDDTGSPKTAYYGGVRRARVSSQAWKRAMRVAFRAQLDQSDLGLRTKQILEVLEERIASLDPGLSDRAEAVAKKALEAAGLKVKAPKKDAKEESEYLVFLSNRQYDRLAEAAIEAENSGQKLAGKAAKEIVNNDHSIDIALFGRMIADAPDVNIDACCQVAHAISVHAVEPEFDYFTAVDDRKEEDDETGAAMIGTVEFNSSTLYRYATIDADRLGEMLGGADATGRAVETAVRAFVTSMPSGKQNTFANRTLPDAVLLTVRDTQPVNLVGAFESPADEKDGRLESAVRMLAAQAEAVDGAFGTTPVAAWSVCVGERTMRLAELAESVSLDELVSGVGELVSERVGRS
ncbi:type I-E CRISPR-associated protein Cas7/Cse4/CasC [Glycomyces xiaoerkulensis]|uniref:type I-E CRISPR-associated protein Cas7/Cse4/CasC n=1 Tax=Glycomyces xiaoerkulensis TaxID=2038139 RepID=UPI000C25C4B3|nr:type I-E CRISPR-associated protein Cas7/Cse4/CasC [Glycomyces xiaoerkulensis]